MENKRENFGGRIAVVAALAGSAIGLGSIWRFPYMVGEYGGAAFAVVYILATFIISLPVFISEAVIGRRARASSFSAMSKLRPGRPLWKAAGVLSVAIPLLINSYYCVIGGWSLEYLFKSLGGEFIFYSDADTAVIFNKFISSPFLPLLMHLLFMAACTFVVARGIQFGIEMFSKITIPALFVLVLVVIIYSISLPGAEKGVEYLVKPDFSQITPRSIAYAMGQSFYSLSLGMGAVITYGSYIKKEESIPSAGIWTAISTLFFAVLAAFAVMPAVFAGGMQPGAGPGLIFQSIPYVFSKMGMEHPTLSAIISIVFFLAVVVAAMTSCISLIEVGVSFLKEKFSMGRIRACLVVFLLCGSLGVICSLSFGPLSSFVIRGKIIFEMLDWLTSNILLLVMSLLTVLFVGFAMKREDVYDEFTNGGTKKNSVRIFKGFYFFIKWIAPVAVLTIFITNFIL